MAEIHQLRTKPEQIAEDTAEDLRQALLPFEPFAPDAVRELLSVVERRTPSRRKWCFIMLNADQNGAVVEYLGKHSERPIVALRLWAMCFQHLRSDSGEILLTREELAEKLKQDPDTISRIMSDLENFGAITRKRARVKGMRGPGVVRYFLNSRVATGLTGAARDKAQTESPQLGLRLIETGRKVVRSYKRMQDVTINATERFEQSGSLLPKGPREI